MTYEAGLAFKTYPELLSMKLRLQTYKRTELTDYSRNNYIRLVVVDLDKSKDYPANFVCILPKTIKLNDKHHTKFERKFGNKSLELAKKLLKRALRAESDREIKAEIRKRLDQLEL
jgi:hypothetical protein